MNNYYENQAEPAKGLGKVNVTDLHSSLTKHTLCPSTCTKGQMPSNRKGKEKPQKSQDDLLD